MQNIIETKETGSVTLNARNHEKTMRIGVLDTFERDTSLVFPNEYLHEALYAMTGYLHYISHTREDPSPSHVIPHPPL